MDLDNFKKNVVLGQRQFDRRAESLEGRRAAFQLNENLSPGWVENVLVQLSLLELLSLSSFGFAVFISGVQL